MLGGHVVLQGCDFGVSRGGRKSTLGGRDSSYKGRELAENTVQMARAKVHHPAGWEVPGREKLALAPRPGKPVCHPLSPVPCLCPACDSPARPVLCSLPFDLSDLPP